MGRNTGDKMRLSKTRKETLGTYQNLNTQNLTDQIRAERKALNRVKFMIIPDDTKKLNRKKDKSARPRAEVLAKTGKRFHSIYGMLLVKQHDTNKYPYNPLITKAG